jgi:hypothetical protein
METSTLDFIVPFTHGSLFFGDDDGDSYLTTKLPVSARVDGSGLAIYSPRKAGHARVRIDMVAALPEIDLNDCDFAAEVFVHTLGTLGISSVCQEVFDTNSRDPTDGTFSVEMGIYRVRVLVANHHRTTQRLAELDREESYDEEDELPTLDSLMTCDHYRIIFAPVEEVSVLKSL